MFGVYTSGAVLFVFSAVLDLGCDEERSITDSYILLARGIALMFVVLWAACDFMLPLGAVEGVAVEFV